MSDKQEPGEALSKDEMPSKKSKRDKFREDAVQTGAALSTGETVGRYGSANSEFIKGYTGIDNETGQQFAKGLKDISNHKVHPDYETQNIKQQAGYSAEVAATSRDNAEAIINRSRKRTLRSDDHPDFGKNHTVVDRVQVLDGKIIGGSQSQMKFVGNRDDLFKKITKPDGEYKRYRGVKLELPSEQYEGAVEHCKKQAKELRHNALRAEQGGKLETAQKLREQAKNYDQLAKNVRDSGLTTEDVIFYRKHPKIATARDIAWTSHRAAMEGAKYGALISGSISLLTNAFAVAQDKKQLSEAAKDTTQDTAKGAAVGYGSAFAGAAIKGGMQQSSKQTIRALSKTNLPTLVLSIVISLGSSIKRCVAGEISEEELLEEIGEKGAGMLSSSMMMALGQLAIPVPFAGAAIGGIIGYSLSSMFYQSALEAAKQSNAAKANLVHVREIEAAARAEIQKQRAEFESFIQREMADLLCEAQQFFAICDDDADVDVFAAGINRFAEVLGARLQFKSQMEFDAFMEDEEARLWF